MRVFLELVDNVSNTIRVIVGLFVLLVMGFGLLMTAGASYVAPKAVESIGERAERLGEKAIEAEERQRRESALAAEGWGYGSDTVGDDGGGDWGESD